MQSYPSPNAIASDSSNPPFYSLASSQQQSGLQNSDDIQMSTQLSGLSPIINAGVGAGLPDGRDPRSQEHNDMSHQYAQQITQAQAQAQHEAAIDPAVGTYRTPDGSTQKQRSKVSQACDECRRKKIKCTASDIPGDKSCRSCRRTKADCRWSREQLKRGPSKGYIKELADRVNTLESQVQHSHGQPQYFSHPVSPAHRHLHDDFAPDPTGQNPAKRRRISETPIDENSYHSLLHSQQPSWGSHEDQRHAHANLSSEFTSPRLMDSTPVLRRAQYSPNTLQTENLRMASESLLQHGISLDSLGRLPTSTQLIYELDDNVLDSYYHFVQPTYPLITGDRSKLQLQLSAVPAQLKDAFCECIHAAVRSFPTNGQPPLERATTRKGAQHMLLAAFDASRSKAENIVHLQCLLLLAIEGGNLAGLQTGQQHPGYAVWLHHAEGLALAMKLPIQQLQASSDPDSEDNTLRRLWWILAITDRFLAATTSTHYIIPEETLVLRSEDQSILGAGVWNMARLAITLGHYSLVNSSPRDPFDLGNGRRLSNELNRCRETFPADFYPASKDYKPLYHMVYWHLQILVSVESTDVESLELLNILKAAIESMKKTPGFISPVKYQCAMVIVLALIDLRGYEKTKDDADAALIDFLPAVGITHWGSLIEALVTRFNSYQSPATIGDGEQPSLDSQRLQRLADLAAAVEDGREVVPVPLPRYGFIKAVLRKGSLSPLFENAV